MNLVQRKEEIIYSLSSIEAAARFCLEHFSGGKIFLFSGDLGAGKTTLISSIMSLLGVTDEVNSPTYVLQHIYRTNDSQIKNVEHWDLYRIGSLPEECEEVVKSDSVRLIEWGERFLDISLYPVFSLSYIDESTRKLEFHIVG